MINIKVIRKVLTVVFIIALPGVLCAQTDNLLNLLEQEMGEQTEEVSATFKATRIINGQSIERMQQYDLNFRVAHRFGPLNSGPYEFFGMDQSCSGISLEYGIFDRLTAGIGRTTYKKNFNGFLKFSLLRQKKGQKNTPVSVSWISGITVASLRWEDPGRNNFFSSRLAYSHQLPVARKFSSRLSLQLTPAMVHRNLVATAPDNNDVFALGAGGRFKITQRIAFCLEYFCLLTTPDVSTTHYGPLSIGVDIETGSHVFQLHFSNSTGITEDAFIGETTGNWLDGSIHFGFNITRVFTLKKDDKIKEMPDG